MPTFSLGDVTATKRPRPLPGHGRPVVNCTESTQASSRASLEREQKPVHAASLPHCSSPARLSRFCRGIPSCLESAGTIDAQPATVFAPRKVSKFTAAVLPPQPPALRANGRSAQPVARMTAALRAQQPAAPATRCSRSDVSRRQSQQLRLAAPRALSLSSSRRCLPAQLVASRWQPTARRRAPALCSATSASSALAFDVEAPSTSGQDVGPLGFQTGFASAFTLGRHIGSGEPLSTALCLAVFWALCLLCGLQGCGAPAARQSAHPAQLRCFGPLFCI